METISTRLAIGLLNELDGESLVELNRFILDFKKHYRNSIQLQDSFKGSKGSFFDLEKFISYVKSKLEISTEKVKISTYQNVMAWSFIVGYKKLLKSLLKDENLFRELFTTILSKKERISSEFIQYLADNSAEKERFLEVLNKINELGIKQFQYDPSIDLNGKQYAYIQRNNELSTPTKTKYMVISIVSDGKKEWEPQQTEDVYNFELRDANYIIEYKKGSRAGNYVKMAANNLDFEPETLPTKEELEDLSVLPKDIDIERIKKMTDAVNIIDANKNVYEQLNKLEKNLDRLIKTLGKADISSQRIESYSKDFSQLKQELETLKSDTIPKYLNNQNLSPQKIRRLLQKTKNKNN